MASKVRNNKSGSSDSSSTNRSTTYNHGRLRSSARSKNRSKNQKPNISTQSVSKRSKVARNRSLPIPAMMHRAPEKPARRRSLGLLSDLRAGEGSYTKLLSDYRLDTRTARKYLGAALRIGTDGRVHASESDRLTRRLLFPGPSGDIFMRIRGSRAASKLSGFFNDRDKLLRRKMTAEEFEAKWRGVRIAGQEVFADAATIFLREEFGDLKVESLYASTSAEGGE